MEKGCLANSIFNATPSCQSPQSWTPTPQTAATSTLLALLPPSVPPLLPVPHPQHRRRRYYYFYCLYYCCFTTATGHDPESLNPRLSDGHAVLRGVACPSQLDLQVLLHKLRIHLSSSNLSGRRFRVKGVRFRALDLGFRVQRLGKNGA